MAGRGVYALLFFLSLRMIESVGVCSKAFGQLVVKRLWSCPWCIWFGSFGSAISLPTPPVSRFHMKRRLEREWPGRMNTSTSSPMKGKIDEDSAWKTCSSQRMRRSSVRKSQATTLRQITVGEISSIVSSEPIVTGTWIVPAA